MIYQFGIIFLIGSISMSVALPPCVCTRERQLVCASNGQTYSNQCMLNCARASDPTVSLVSVGRCKREAPSCFCTFENNPICASNGETYANECEFQCQQTADPTLRINYHGECREKRQIKVASLSPCTCPRDSKFVCGSDGATYSNACVLECSTQANPSLYMVHGGPCDNRVNVVEHANNLPSCSCARNYFPVCGTDGNTYNNICLLQCSGTDVQSFGPC